MSAVSVPRGWRRFGAWAAVGACLALGVSVVGLITIPVGVVLAVWLTRNPSGHSAIGALAGAGAVTVFVGILHRGYQPCSSHAGALALLPRQQSVGSSCGGIDGWHWIVAGTAVIVLATVIHAFRQAAQPGAPSRRSASSTISPSGPRT